MQDADAEWRLNVLRGQNQASQPNDTTYGKQKHHDHERPSRKRRRVMGEDDTDRDIRFAREDNELAKAQRKALICENNPKDILLADTKGNINLFTAEQAQELSRKTTRAEREESARRERDEDKYMMRLSNAAGYNQGADAVPWYSSIAPAIRNDGLLDGAEKDVWGKEDLGRNEREKVRLSANDPLAMMRQGVKNLRQSEQERQRWNLERSKELRDLKSSDRAKDKRHKRHEGHVHIGPFSSSRDELRGNETQIRHRLHDHGRRHRIKSRRSRSPEHRHHGI